MTHPMLRRQEATQATVDAYQRQPLELGKRDCARMTASHLKRLGHAVSLAKAGGYSTPIGAARALRKIGCRDLGEALDQLGLVRIPPARAVMGDVFGLRAKDGGLALHIALDHNTSFGPIEGEFSPGRVHEVEACWRVI